MSNLTTSTLSELPPGVSYSTRVVACTAIKGHTACVARAGEAVKSGTSTIETTTDGGRASESPLSANDPDASAPGTGSQAPSSATGLQLREAKRCRSLTTNQLVALLRPRYLAQGSGWRLADVKNEVVGIDPGAGGIASHVLRKLRGVDALTPTIELELIQGLATILRAEGWGIELHVANGACVRGQAVELARKRFYAIARKLGDEKARFDPQAASLKEVHQTPQRIPTVTSTHLPIFVLICAHLNVFTHIPTHLTMFNLLHTFANVQSCPHTFECIYLHPHTFANVLSYLHTFECVYLYLHTFAATRCYSLFLTTEQMGSLSTT